MGFNADSEFVDSINTFPEAYGALRGRGSYGLTVTPAEAAELAVRTAVQESLEDLETFIEAESAESYAGMYTDQAGGGIVHVGLTEWSADEEARFREFFPFPERLTFFEARHTYAELKELADHISRASEELEAQGVGLSYTSVEVADNIVEVGVEELTESALTVLERQFGDNSQLRVVEARRPVTQAADPGRDNTIREVRGGLTIHPRSNGGPRCSTAFRAHNGSYKYVLTAGHCYYTEGSGRFQGQHPDGVWRAIGDREYNLYAAGNRVDAQAIRLHGGIQSRDDVYVHPGRTLVDVGSWQASADDDHAGDFVCMTGTFSPGDQQTDNCGILTRKDFAPNYKNANLTYTQLAPTMRCATYKSDPGDSGGGVYREVSSGIFALGIHSGSGCGADDNEAIYGHIGIAMADLGGGLQVST